VASALGYRGSLQIVNQIALIAIAVDNYQSPRVIHKKL